MLLTSSRATPLTSDLKVWVAFWAACLRSPFRSAWAVAIAERLSPIASRFARAPSTVTVATDRPLSSSTCSLMSARAEQTAFCALSSFDSPQAARVSASARAVATKRRCMPASPGRRFGAGRPVAERGHAGAAPLGQLVEDDLHGGGDRHGEDRADHTQQHTP